MTPSSSSSSTSLSTSLDSPAPGAAAPRKRGFVWFLALTLIAASTSWAGAARAEPRIFVSAEDAGEIDIILPAQGKVIERIKVGRRPRGLRLSANGKFLYVALTGTPKPDAHGGPANPTPQDRAADGVAVVDVVGHKLLRTLNAGQAPVALDLSPDGKIAYVANSETAEVSVLDLETNKILKKIGVGPDAAGVAFRPDGKVVYVTSAQASEVYAIDTATMRLLTRVDAGATPRSVAFSRDGGLAFVTDEQGAVTWLDGRQHAFQSSLFMLHDPKLHDPPQPLGVVLARDGKSLFVTSGRSGSVLVLDVAKHKLVRAIDRVGGFPRGIGISPDGKTLFTANAVSGDVSVIDIASGKIEKRVAVGGAPWGLAVAGP